MGKKNTRIRTNIPQDEIVRRFKKTNPEEDENISEFLSTGGRGKIEESERFFYKQNEVEGKEIRLWKDTAKITTSKSFTGKKEE